MFSFAWFWTFWLGNYIIYILPLRDIWIVSSFELLWARTLWTFLYASPDMCMHILKRGTGGLHGTCAFNLLDNAKLFPEVLVPIYILIHNIWEFLVLHYRSNIYQESKYPIVALMSTSLKSDEVEHLYIWLVNWIFSWGNFSLIVFTDCLSMRCNFLPIN